MKRSLSFLLTLLMLITALPLNALVALAEELTAETATVTAEPPHPNETGMRHIAPTTIAELQNEHLHSYQSTVTPPTCTEQGYTTYTCEVCGDSYVADYTDFWEIGTIAAATGTNTANATRLRMTDFLRLEDYSGVTVNNRYTLTYFVYDESKAYLGNGTEALTGYWLGSGVPVKVSELLSRYPTGVYFRVALRAMDSRALTLEDLTDAGVTFYQAGEDLPAKENELKHQEIMNVDSRQDGAIWNDKLFVLGENGTGAVYDLITKQKLSFLTPDRADVLLPHANSVCFGSTFYASGDQYPLLYVNIYNNYGNAEDRMEGTCCVYRITEENGQFVTKLVQVIEIGFTEDLSLWKSKENNGDVRPYGNFVIDTDQNKLYAYVMRDKEETTRFFSFGLPALSEGVYHEEYGCNVVTLQVSDIQSQFDTDYFNYLQGGCYYDGMIFSLEGFGASNANESALRIIDLSMQKLLKTYYLGDSALTAEPEVICVDPVSGTIYYAAADGILRTLALPDRHTHSYTATVTKPTCTEKGYTTYACDCGESYAADEVAATGHSYTSTITRPTATTQGYTTYTCEVCGESYVSDYTDFTGFDSYEEAVKYLREQMVARVPSVTVRLYGVQLDENQVYNFRNDAWAHTGVPNEGDYIRQNCLTTSCSAVTGTDTKGIYTEMHFGTTWFTTAAQEAEVDVAVADLLAEWNLENATDYQKIKCAYDWVCTNVVYDHDNLYDNTYLLKHSAYAALIHGKAVCQGFASLFYRLCLELGVDCRVIIGYTDESHAWNIVKLDDKYYNMDPTYDRGTGNYYRYFLTTIYSFGGHDRNAEYETDAFNAAYPMATLPYVEKVAAAGTLSNGMEWILDGNTGVLTVTGNGAIPDYRQWNAPWEPYSDSILGIELSEGITQVGDRAFAWCKNATYLSLPSTLKVICEYGFNNCRSLTELELPDGLTTLEFCAFSECSGLTGVYVSAKLTNIGSSVFSNCPNIATIEFGEGFTHIADSMFSNTAIKELILPDTIVSIGTSAFARCEKLTYVRIPASVTYISHSAFINCSKLRQIGVVSDNPNYLSSFGVLFTKDAKTLVCFPAGMIPDRGTYTVPTGVTTIGDSAFYGASHVTRLVIPDSVTLIDDYAFAFCDGLYSVDIGPNVTRLGDTAFGFCTSLTSITFANPKMEIDNYCFTHCTKLKSFTFPAEIPALSPGTLTDCHAITEIEIPKNVSVIESGCFQFMKSLKKVTIPANITKLENCAFFNCTALEEVVIEGDLSFIDWSAFDTCSNLKFIHFKGIVASFATTTDRELFRDCPVLFAVYFDDLATAKKVTSATAFGNLCKNALTVAVPRGSTGLSSFITTNYPIRSTISKDGVAYDLYSKHTCSWSTTGSAVAVGCERRTPQYCTICRGKRDAITYVHSYTTAYDPPSCTEDGKYTYICTACGYSFEELVPATGHSYESVVTPPTCTEDGYTTYTCHCGDSYVGDYVETIWHTYADGVCADCGCKMIRVSADDLTRYQGGVNSEDGTINATFTNNWYANIPIPKNARQVRFQTFKTASNWGSAFLGSTGFLSGVCDPNVGGRWSSLEIPNGATTFRYGYLYDQIAQNNGWEIFQYVEFAGAEMEEWEPLPDTGRPATGCHSFSVEVNIAPAMGDPDGYIPGTDYGYITFPSNYTANGEPTRLIIVCHGAGASLSDYQSDAWKTTNYSFWTELGYAVMDMYACPQELSGSDSCLHYGNPVVLDCYKAGYDYVMENFNLKQDGVFVIGSSMGGLSSFQIVQSGAFPVLAQVAYCPVIDLFKQAYCNPWTTASYQRERIASYFGFEGIFPTFTSTKFPTEEEIAFYRQNFDKTIPYSPILKNVVAGNPGVIFDVIPTSATSADAAEAALYAQLTATHPCPLLIFHNTDDSTVSYRYSRYLTDMINRSGQEAVLYTFTSGGHNAWANGETVAVDGINGTITIKESQYQAYLFFNQLETHEDHYAWVDPAMDATCTENGLTQGSHCASCGEILKAQETVAATGHSFGEWETTKEATCTVEGEQRRDCTSCDHYETRVITATGHSYNAVVTKPTCTEQGFTTYTCHCGDSYVDDYVDVRPLNILMIGNSFSHDAARQLRDILKAMLGEDSNVEIHLAINAAKTMAWHATQASENAASYKHRYITEDGKWVYEDEPLKTLEEIMAYADWTAVTLQSYAPEATTGTAKGLEGETTSFLKVSDSVPFLLDYIHEHAPNASIYYYLIWQTTTDTSVLNAGLDGYREIASLAQEIAAMKGKESGFGFQGVIPVGTAVQNARSTYLGLLNYKAEKEAEVLMGLQRDSVHMAYTLGGYIAALTIAEYLIPADGRLDEYALPAVPNSSVLGKLPPEYTVIAQKAVAMALEHPYSVTARPGYETDPAGIAQESFENLNLTFAGIATEEELKNALLEAANSVLPREGFAVPVVTLTDSTFSADGTLLGYHGTVTFRFGYTTCIATTKNHPYTAIITPPTCTAEGYTTYTCHCGDSYVADKIPATGHSYGEWYTTQEATCTVDGEQRRDCANCNHYETKSITATGHSYTAVVTKPTCTAEGFTTYTCHCGDSYVADKIPATGHSFGQWYTVKEATCTENGEQRRDCKICDVYETKAISATGHSYNAVVTKPTCTAEGYTTYTCHCGDTYVDDKVPATGHSFGEWYTVKDATCTANGEQRRDCANCDHFETQPIASTGHSYTATVTKPTCTAEGYTTYTCHCGDSYVADKTPATGHSYSQWHTLKEAACTENGMERRECEVCNHYETKPIPATGHALISHPGKAPTCTEKGWAAYEACEVCDYTTYTELPAAGHSYQATITKPTCTEEGFTTYTCHCGDSYVANKVPPAGHAWDNGVITLPPTEEITGKKVFTCTSCGEQYTLTLPTLEHTHRYEAVVTPPTCTEKGYTTYTCRCGDQYVAEILSPLGHAYTAAVTQPTCTEGGFTTYTCTVCGDSYQADFTPATGHSYESVVTKPTCTEQGYTTYTCTVCKESYVSNYIQATGHSYESLVTDPTCTEKGYVTYTCHCGDTYTGNYIPAVGHSWDEGVITVEPTEEQAGRKVYTCAVCGETEEETLPPLEHIHRYEGMVTEPTCTEQGFTTYTCRCGDSYVSDYTDAKGHSFGEWYTVTDPTCTADGTERRDCADCDVSETQTIAATGHKYDAIVTEPTCTEQGYTTYTCHCGNSYVSDYAEPAGHAWSEWYDVTPGKEERSCNACGETEIRDKIPDYDVDRNGTVDQADVTLLMSVLVGNTETDALFDFDFDGELTIYDCVLLMQQIS